MPQIQVWINKDTDTNVEKLVKSLNGTVTANSDKRLKAFFIFVDDTGKQFEPELTLLAKKTDSNDVALAYLGSNHQGVRTYKIYLDPEVKNTIIFYRNRKVLAKEVNFVADEKGLSKLKSDIDLILK